MEKADPCARSGVISFGSCSLPQVLGTNGLVVVVCCYVVSVLKPESAGSRTGTGRCWSGSGSSHGGTENRPPVPELWPGLIEVLSFDLG